MTNESKKCFIITPIGPDNSDVRRAAEGVIDTLIEPIVSKKGFKIEVAHKMDGSGSITKQLLSSILTSELVIANLTGLNPNVMYELAVRHATKKPIVQLCEQGTVLPFDISDERTIFYTNDMAGVIETREKLNSMIDHALTEEDIDNPIYRATTEVNILKQVEVDDPEKFSILKRMDELERLIISATNKNKVYKLSDRHYFNKEESIESFKLKLKPKSKWQQDYLEEELMKRLPISRVSNKKIRNDLIEVSVQLKFPITKEVLDIEISDLKNNGLMFIQVINE